MLILLATTLITLFKGGTCAVYEIDFAPYELKVKPQSCILIDIGFNLLMAGRVSTYFIPAIEYELFKQIKEPYISNETIAELVLIKAFFTYLRNDDFESVLQIFESFCSSHALMPVIDELESLLKKS